MLGSLESSLGLPVWVNPLYDPLGYVSVWSPHMPYSKNYFHFLFPFLDPSVGGCSSDGCSDGIVKLVASLSMQVCRMNPPFCEDLHRGPQSSQELPNPSVLKMREEMLQVSVIQSVYKKIKMA